MRTFADIYATALMHKGSVAAVEALLPHCVSAAELAAQPDAFYLSEMSRRVFRAGLKHSMVDAKWPDFERAFYGFDPLQVAMMSDEAIDLLMADSRLIRHLGKLKSVRDNAAWVLDIGRQHGSFGHWLGAWPVEDTVGLWLAIKAGGRQLGGQSAARFLRMVGRDTFLLTDDVVAVLQAERVVTGMPAAKRDLRRVQEVFNQWRQESGRCFCEISRIVSLTADSH